MLALLTLLLRSTSNLVNVIPSVAEESHCQIFTETSFHSGVSLFCVECLRDYNVSIRIENDAPLSNAMTFIEVLTRRYMGLRQEEILQTYDYLTF